MNEIFDLGAANAAIKRAEALVEKATPGPWALDDDTEELLDTHNISIGVVYGAHGEPDSFPCLDDEDEDFVGSLMECKANAAFIPAARSLVPELAGLLALAVGQLDKAHRELAQLRAMAEMDAAHDQAVKDGLIAERDALREAAELAISALEWAGKSGDHLRRCLHVLVGYDESMGLNRAAEKSAMTSWLTCAGNIDVALSALRRARGETK